MSRFAYSPNQEIIEKHDVNKNSCIYNPFGPNIYHSFLENDDREHLLKVVNDYHEKTKDRDAKSTIIQSSTSFDIEKNTISNGILKGLDLNFINMFDTKINETIINNTKEYVKLILLNSKSLRDKKYKFLRPNRTEEDQKKDEQSLSVENVDIDVKIDGAWYVKMKRGDFHIIHDHQYEKTEYSGGIYLDVPELSYPQGTLNFSLGQQNSFYDGVHTLNPKNGDIFIWPSWLQHSVYPFDADGTRIMISFNATSILQDNRDFEPLEKEKAKNRGHAGASTYITDGQHDNPHLI